MSGTILKAFSRHKLYFPGKASGSQELKRLTIPFACREFIQNIEGQGYKDLQTRQLGSNEWKIRNLVNKSRVEREEWKLSLDRKYPGALTGLHGRRIERSRDILPAFTAEMHIPKKLIKRDFSDDFRALICIWHDERNTLSHFTFFNNHLDHDATLESFLVDGQSTSKKNPYAVGEFGKGFSGAFQYLYEIIDSRANGDKLASTLGVSCRIGDKFGVGSFKTSAKTIVKVFQTSWDDLKLLSRKEILDNESTRQQAEGGNMLPPTELNLARARLANINIQELRVKYGMSGKPKSETEIETLVEKPEKDQKIAKDDEVSINIYGLDGLLGIDTLSANFGFKPLKSKWPVENTDFTFFKVKSGKLDNEFYHRRQQVPYGCPTVPGLSVNYEGDLILTPDRSQVVRDGEEYQIYCTSLSKAIDIAFRTQPTLANELARGILTASPLDPIHDFLVPSSNLEETARGYRSAFQNAFQRFSNPDESPPSKQKFHYPILKDDTYDDLSLIKELGYRPITVNAQLRKILNDSKAFPTITSYAQKALLSKSTQLHSRTDQLEGTKWNRLLKVLHELFFFIPEVGLDIRKLNLKTPIVIWDVKTLSFIVSQPNECEYHQPSGQCLCHVLPTILAAVKSFKEKEVTGGKYAVHLPMLSEAHISRVYTEKMADIIEMHDIRINPTLAKSKDKPALTEVETESEKGLLKWFSRNKKAASVADPRAELQKEHLDKIEELLASSKRAESKELWKTRQERDAERKRAAIAETNREKLNKDNMDLKLKIQKLEKDIALKGVEVKKANDDKRRLMEVLKSSAS